MLTPAEWELISAAVDGELTADEQAAVRRLTAADPVAAARFAALCRDRDRLANLPRKPAPAGLHPAVMAKVRQVTPARSAARRFTWVPIGVAAGFLVAVGSGAFLSVGPRASADRLLAQQSAALPKTDVAPPANDSDRVAVELSEPDPLLDVTPVPFEPDAPPVVAIEPKPNPTAPAPKQVPNAGVLASPPLEEPKPFDRVKVKLPLLLPLAEVTTDDGRQTLREQLAGTPLVRVELFARDTLRAAEMLVETSSGAKTAVSVETIAGERLKRKMPSVWAVFSDGHSADDLTAWLTGLAAADQASPSKVFTSLHIIPALPADVKECERLFGVDPAGKKAKPVAGPKPISAGTLDSVTAAVVGAGEKPAVLVTYLPAAARVNPALSRDLRAYHERKGERKPGAVAVLLVIRPANG